MPTLVPGEGPLGARIVVIGEAPGAVEEAQRRPFVGASGQRLTEWIEAAGLRRSDLRIDNVYPYRPLNNQIRAVPRAELQAWIDDLHDRLAQLTEPYVIVPTGDTALRALIGKTGIMRHRGSIYRYTDTRDRSVKVIPTLHPAYVLRDPAFEKRCRRDWQRIASDSTFRELRLPVRDCLIQPTLADILTFVADAARADRLAIDIETPRTVTWQPADVTKTGTPKTPKKIVGPRTISCIGFSYTPSFALTIPTTRWYWQDDETLAEVWRRVATLCTLPVAKVFQNGLFDTFWLAEYGITVANWQWDTLCLHHALDAADEHSLAYMASIDTRQPYWKDMKDSKEGDDADEVTQASADDFWTYNSLDAAVTRELADVYIERLDVAGRLDFYTRHYRALFDPLLSLMRGGVATDDQARVALAIQYRSDRESALTALSGLAGRKLHGPKGALSPKALAEYLYGTLKLPPRKDRETGKVTTKETALRALMIRYPDKAGPPGLLILKHRRAQKLAEFVADGVADADGRVRCSYRFTTSTGRLASSENPRGTGRNLQNVDRAVRSVFVPEPGHVIMELDLSQAEARIVGMLTGDPEMIRLAQAPPWEFDVHRRNAALIFRVAEAAVTSEQRYLGKRAVHASNYGLHGRKLSEELLKEEDASGASLYVKTPTECQAMIDAYLNAHPPIRDWQRRVRITVLNQKQLVNTWGRVFDVRYERLSDDLFRAAYAFQPQSEVADLLNQWGLVPAHALIQSKGLKSRLLLQVHDSLVFSAAPDEAWGIYVAVKASLEQPRRYLGTALSMPVEVKLGRTWKTTVTFKKPPGRNEFDAAIQALIGGNDDGTS